MPILNLRRYDTQAFLGLVLSSLAAVCLLVMTAFILSADARFEYFSFKDWTITYGPLRYKLVMLSGALTILLAISGFGFGWNSAGQRRNEKPHLSWISFFIGGAVLCTAIILLFFFVKQGQPVLH